MKYLIGVAIMCAINILLTTQFVVINEGHGVYAGLCIGAIFVVGHITGKME